METKRQLPKGLPENEKTERHKGAIVVGRSRLAHERPHGGPKDLWQVVPALYIGVLQDLLIIVIYESIEQCISVADQGYQNKQRDEDLV